MSGFEMYYKGSRGGWHSRPNNHQVDTWLNTRFERDATKHYTLQQGPMRRDRLMSEPNRWCLKTNGMNKLAYPNPDKPEPNRI